jgi:hypothetical protein
MPCKMRGEMALAGKTTLERNLRERQSTVRQQMLRSFEPALQHIAIRRVMCGCAEQILKIGDAQVKASG